MKDRASERDAADIAQVYKERKSKMGRSSRCIDGSQVHLRVLPIRETSKQNDKMRQDR